jgi:putative ABC transport system permease protein
MLPLLKSISRRHWRRHPGRAVLLVASIALGVAAWIATQELTENLERTSRLTAHPLGMADLTVSNGDAGVPQSWADDIRSIPGIQAVRPLVIQRGLLSGHDHSAVLLLGVDFPQDGEAPSWDVTVERTPTTPTMGSLMFGGPPVLVGQELDKQLAPEETRFTVSIGGKMHRFSRAGVIREARGAAVALAGNTVILPQAVAADMVGRPDLVSRIDLFLDAAVDVAQVRHAVAVVLHGQAQVNQPEAGDNRSLEMLAGLKLGFSLCGAASLLIGLFLIYNVLSISVAERRHEVAMLRCIGATVGQIIGLFLSEAAVLATLGIALGLPLGVALASLAMGPLQSVVSDVFVSLTARQIEVHPAVLFQGALAGLATALIAGLVPALRASREQPVRALRRVPPASCWSPLLRASLSLTTGLIGALLVSMKGLLPARVGSFGGLVFLVLAVIVGIPVLAAMAARLARPVIGRLGISFRLAVDNLIRDPGRPGVVIAALAVGVAMLLLTAGLIQNNELAIRDWVDRCIAGDLFVTAGGPLSASGQTVPMFPGVGRLVKQAIPEAQIVPMSFRHLDLPHDGRTSRVLLFALDATAYVAANEQRGLSDIEEFRRLCEPNTALVSNNFAALYGVAPGDTIALPGATGPVSLHVVGTVDDFSCPGGEILIDRSPFVTSFHAEMVDVFDVYLPAGTDADAIAQRLQQSPLAADQALCVLTKSQVRGHILGMVHRLYALAYAQQGVVGLVAMLGIVAALLISVMQRRRELALLRTLGATCGQVFRSVLAEAVLIGAAGTLIGLFLGLPLLWYTERVILFEESGFLFPWGFPWAFAGLVAAVAVGCGALAGFGPALVAMRSDCKRAMMCE